MENFRILDKKADILKLLHNVQENGEKGEIWQTLSEKRFNYKINKIVDDDNNRVIVFEVDQKVEFNQYEAIYVRIFHRDLIFKLDPGAYIASGKKIAAPYPEAAKAIESRGMARLIAPIDKDIDVVLKPLGESATEIRVRLYDISRGGLGILISDMNKDFLIRNKFFKIITINDIEMTGQNDAEVRYVKKIKKGILKAGLMLRTPFVDAIYDYICKEIFSSKK